MKFDRTPLARLMFSVAAAAALLSFALPALAQVSHTDESVSDDGSVPASAREGSLSYSPSFRGAPGVLELSRKEMTAAGMKPAPADFRERVRKAKSPLTGLPLSDDRPSAESVIGPDGRTRVINTKTFPARATVMILFGGNGCTGWLVNRNTVVTAGHCVSPGNGTMYPKATYEISPGYNDMAADPTPYGTCGAKRLYTNVTWRNNARDDFDYGAIKLDCTLPAAIGFFGYSRSVARNNPITVQGYPGDKPFGTQWTMAGLVTILEPRRIFYRIDTFGGQSGSAIWRRVNANCTHCGVGIHAYGVYGAPPFSKNNHGTRITGPVFNAITTWKNAP